MSGPVLGRRGLVAWAIVGDVLNPSKPASSVASSIEDQGRVLYRVSPALDVDDASDTKRLYRKFGDIPPDAKIDAVNLCINYRIGMTVLDEMKKRDVKYCFVQPGADHVELLRKADESGVVYEIGCMIVQRLPDLNDGEKRLVDEQKRVESASGCACNII